MKNTSGRRIWAMIPARGGSKRLPRKNCMPLAGISPVERTVKTAFDSAVFEKVAVSTDCEEIADIASRAGAEVPFIRPSFLSGDQASSLDVLVHFVDHFSENETETLSGVDAIALLQCTSPLLRPEIIQKAVEVYFGGEFNSLSSMKRVTQHPGWMFRVDSELHRAIPEDHSGIITSSSELPVYFIENGAVYIVSLRYLQKNNKLYDFANHGMIEMSQQESLDIDTKSDWDYAEYLLGAHS